MKKIKMRNDHSGCQTSRRGKLRKLLSGFLAVTTAFTMMSGNAGMAIAEEPFTEYALAGAGSGRDVTVHFGDGEDQHINIHVNPESNAQEEASTLAGAYSENALDAETETETEYSAETEADVENTVEAVAETEADTEYSVETEEDVENIEETEAETEADAKAAYFDLTASYVDQFGDLIGDAYLSVPLPAFSEDGVLDLVASEEYKPVADFAVWQDAASKAIQYSYMRARVNYRTIKAIRIGNMDPLSSDTNTDVNVQTSDAGMLEEETEAEMKEASGNDTGYYYTNNYTEWKKLEDTDLIEFVFTSGKQREYLYEDDNIKVNATLQHAWAIPDGAQLKVTQITPQSSEYNYSAYMDALNEGAPDSDNKDAFDTRGADGTNSRYNKDNTLFYDIAFLAVKYDAEGNPIEGSDYEYEPADGSVSLSVEFKESQLTNNLRAANTDDIAVFHLPLTEKIKAETDTTAQATEITPSDITVEKVDLTTEDVSLEKDAADSVSFQADSFSTFAFANGRIQTNYWDGTRKYAMTDILSTLGGLTNYAVVAGTLHTGHHIEGNIRVRTFEITDSGAQLNCGSRVDTYNNPDQFTINKTVRNGNGGTFQFVIVDENTNTELKRFEITASGQGDGAPTGSVTFTKDGSGGTTAAAEVFKALYDDKHIVRVYELNGSGQRVLNGGKNGNMTVTYSSAESSGEAGAVGNSEQNYIGEFDYIRGEYAYPGSYLGVGEHILGPFVSGEEPHKVEGQPGNYIFFGTDNDVCVQNSSIDHFTYDPDLKTTITGDLDRVANLSSALAKAYNGDTSSPKSKNYGSDLSVINLISTTGELCKDLQNAGFIAGVASENEKNVIKDMMDRGEYLLINIDVGSYSNYSINGQSIYFDGKNPQGDGGYSDIGSHVIYNLVKSSNNRTSFTAFDGQVKVADWSAGLLLAPKADIAQDAYWIGEIIGKRVTHGGAEIHKKTTVSGTNRKVSINVDNTYTTPDDDNTRLTVKKEWVNSTGQEIDPDVDSIPVKLYRMPALLVGNYYTVNVYAYYNKHSQEILGTFYVKRPATGAAPFSLEFVDDDTSHVYSTWDNKKEPFTVSKRGNTWTYSTPDLALNNQGGGNVVVRVSCNDGSIPTRNVQVNAVEGSYTPADRSTAVSSEDTSWTRMVNLQKSQNWTYSLNNLDTKDANGNPYFYYAEEQDTSGTYQISYDNNGTPSGTITVTNTVPDKTPDKTQIEVKKLWPGNVPGTDEVSIDLYYKLGPVSEDEAYGIEDLSDSTDGISCGHYTITAAENWSTTINDLDLYETSGDTQYQRYYYVKENAILGYSASYDNNCGISSGTITITNEESEKLNLTVQKIWKDGDVQITNAAELPAEVEVKVYQVKTAKTQTGGGNAPLAVEYGTLTLHPEENWQATIVNLPSVGVENGIEYTYSYYVSEVPVGGFNTSYTPSIPLTASVGGNETTLYTPQDNSITIVNTLERTDIPVSKEWQDNQNANRRRPESITLHLMNDTAEIQTIVVRPAADGSWSHLFTNLPKYRYVNHVLTPVNYTVTEDVPANYSLSLNRSEKDERGVVTSIKLINTENASYSMPATGGEGTRRIYLMSLMMVMLAGAGLIMIRRRKEEIG